MNKRKPIPRFKNENAERGFWAKHDATDYVDLKSGFRARFPNLKPTLRTISIRLPEHLIGDLRALANERDIPYQALLKQFLAERVEREWRRHHAA